MAAFNNEHTSNIDGTCNRREEDATGRGHTQRWGRREIGKKKRMAQCEKEKKEKRKGEVWQKSGIQRIKDEMKHENFRRVNMPLSSDEMKKERKMRYDRMKESRQRDEMERREERRSGEIHRREHGTQRVRYES